MTLSQDVLKTIKQEKICPKSKWTFVLKNWSLWLIGLLFLGVGSLASAVILYMVSRNDWDLSDRVADSQLGFILETLPYFWLLLLIVFLLLAYYQVKNTKCGYRYNIYAVIITSLIMSILLGTIFFNLGLGEGIDEYLADTSPTYGRMFCSHSVVWHRPEKGLLIGVIDSAPEQQKVVLVDLFSKKWWVLLNELSADKRLMPGKRVKVIGQDLGQNNFLAEEIRFFPCSCEEIGLPSPCGCQVERKPGTGRIMIEGLDNY